MSAQELVKRAIDAGILLQVKDGRLKFEATRDHLSDELREQLKANRDELIAYLRELAVKSNDSLADQPALYKRPQGGPPAPASHAQERLWFVDQLEGGSAQYNMQNAYRVEGRLDIPALQRALNEIVMRHEVLRTRLTKVADTLRQIVEPRFEVPLQEFDLTQLSANEQESAIAQILREDAAKPFDLDRDVLLRVRICKLSDTRSVISFNMHHIVSDGWSLSVLISEFSQLYVAHKNRTSSPLAPLSIQYGDYATWQRDRLAGGMLAKQMGFWKTYLDQPPLLHSLPLDRPRPPRQTFRGKRHGSVLSEDLTAKIKTLCQQHGVTLFMLLETALAILFARYGGETDIVLGTPLAGRLHQDVEPLIGLFVNTLAIRTKVDLDASFTSTLLDNRHSILDAYDNQDVPIDTIVEELNPQRNLAHAPLFQIIFLMQNTVGRELSLPGLILDPIVSPEIAIKFDLEIDAVDTGGRLHFGWVYNSTLFEASSVAALAASFEAMLHAVVENPEQRIRTLPLLNQSQRERILDMGKGAVPAPLTTHGIHQLFEEQVQRDPNAIALVAGDEALSYGELNAQANRLAHYLIEHGVRPDSRVTICVERSFAMVIGLLAILKAGGAYVPLDPAYPSDRLAMMFSDAAPVVLLADVDGLKALREVALASVTPLLLGTAQASWDKYPGHNPVITELRPDHLAYVIYTSGSTGVPKGVMVEHRQVLQSTLARNNYYSASASSRFLLLSSVAFDSSVAGIFGTLTSGGSLHLPDRESAQDPQVISEIVERENISRLLCVPSLALLLLAYLPAETRGVLREILLGGESCPPALAQAAHAFDPELGLYNEYGPTEATVWATVHRCHADETYPVPIGRPIAGTFIYLMDDHGQLVPPGATGEIYIGGSGVARGYLDRPEITAERFVSDPFSAAPDARMYRTGDLARYRHDGNIEFLGRNDHQAKIRGFRIEVGEIEARLADHSAVRECTVLVREDVPGDKRLVAYVVSSDDKTPEFIVVLRAHLSSCLPDYMVPAAFVMLDALPLTPNGKLDREALPEPDDNAFVRHAYELPQGETEATLALIWQELLGLERVGRHDHFFELGGHSLLAIRMMERLRPLGLSTDIRALFATPSLADFARALGSHQEVIVPPNRITTDCATLTPEMLPLIDLAQADIDHIVARVPGGLANIQDIYALSPLQEGILFHHLLATQGDPYLNVVQMAFSDRALLDRYLATLQNIVDRHDILRTAFFWEDISTPAQVVLRRANLSVIELDLDLQDGPINEQLATRFDPRQHRIDITQAPLFRLVIARDLAQDRWLVLHLLHHLIGDHSTSEIMYTEALAFLTDRGDGLAAPHPFRNLIAQSRLGVSQEAHEAFFRTQLADIDEPSLPFGIAEVHRDGSAITESRLLVSEALNHRLRAQSRRLGVSLASLCHLAWGQVISRTSGRETVAFGTVLFGRMQAGEGADRAMGVFINTLPLRLDLDDTSVEESARLAHHRLADLLAHEHAPLSLAQRCSGVTAPAPLFSALLNYRHNVAVEAETPDKAAMFAGIEWLDTEERNNYPITLSVEDFGDALGLVALVVQSLSPTRVCAYMQQALESLVQALETTPHMPVRELDILPPDERTLLLETWNQTDAAYPADRCLHQLFEEHVQRDPDAIAVVMGTQTLSYGALNAQANRLAHYLIEHGVRPDDRVAICVERSFAMVIGLIAILKAGGAYVPLDPAYPSARLAQVLTDAEPVLVLSDAAGRTVLGEAVMHARTVLDLEHAQPAWNAYPDTNPDASAHGLTSRHLAYVIYTSGSTGTPKGVMVEHQSLINYFAWALPVYYAGQTGQGSPASLSFAFDGSVTVLFGPLLAGQALTLLPADAIFETLSEQATAHTYAALKLTPTHLRMLSPLLADAQAPTPASTLILGGEMLNADDLAFWHRNYPQVALINEYGPTETTIGCTHYRALADQTDLGPVAIGRPIANTRIYLLDAHRQPVPLGAIGEIYIGGDGVARGYLNRPDLTAERFLVDPFSDRPEARMYRTGDLARYLPDGHLVYLGRNDHQVKLRGFRIELGEIEARLTEHPAVRNAVVLAMGEGSHKRLVAYVVPADGHDGRGVSDSLVTALRTHLAACLPDYMVPAAFVALEALPLSPNGKLERKALPAPDQDALAQQAYVPPRGKIENALTTIWQDLLGLERVGIHDHFFEVGGTSLHTIALKQKIRDTIGFDVSIIDLFTYPTIARLANYLLAGEPDDLDIALPTAHRDADGDTAIAIIGMAGRFPDARDVETFWSNIANGVESLRSYTREALQLAGIDRALLDNPNFVPARSVLDGIEDFDAGYFGFTPREAEVTDPQQRVLLECAHEALEAGGYGDAKCSRSVGVFAGVGENFYVLEHLLPQIDAFAALGSGITHANSKDFAATRISYKLNLSGPSISVNTACSTSLVAIHQACCSLARGECQMALAGAASIAEFGPGGYLYQEGGISSPDGHCRAFDRDAKGTRRGNGAGVLLLKRLDRALADGDTIHAVIKGSAINNDGSDKVGYTAPSVSGQARAIGQAYRNAGLSPASIQYVEAHGTGTVLGDPIEMRALNQAFVGAAVQSCAIGSVKPNVGHLDTAAGVAGLIKTVEAMKHRQLPPSIHYAHANPQIDFDSSPFYVNTQLREWPATRGPRRAGVSSFGIGGTNVHVVLEEAPTIKAEPTSKSVQLLLVSARSAATLSAASAQLAAYLLKDDAAPLPDVAYTLQVGRTRHAYRRAVTCETAAEAIAKLTSPAMENEYVSDQDASLVWMFPGQGSQHVDMAHGLYTSEPVFREQLDVCAEGSRELLGIDLREVLYPSPETREEAAKQLKQTSLAQPALFAVEYSLAKLLQSYGIEPDAMIGHSLGEYVAACIAGVFSLQEALRLVAARGRLMQGMATGRMLSVLETEASLRTRLSDSALSLAAINDKEQCVVSGPIEAIKALREQLRAEGIESRELETSHAFHSAMMEPVLAAWRNVVRGVQLSTPKIPYVSNLNGDFVCAEEVTDPEYWVRHLRETVRFGDGLETLMSPLAPLKKQRVLMEVGPGQVLSGLAKRRSRGTLHAVLPLLARTGMAMDDVCALHKGIGQLWLHGAQIDWAGYHRDALRRRVPLPTYPFERQRYWVEAVPRSGRTATANGRSSRHEDWFHAPLWRLRGIKTRTNSSPLAEVMTWIVMTDRHGMGEQLVEKLRNAGHSAIVVRQGNAFARIDRDEYALAADNERHYNELVSHIERDGLRIDHLVHLWALDLASEDAHTSFELFEERQRTGYYSLMFAIKALVAQPQGGNAACYAITHDAFRVNGGEALAPEYATITGLCKVAPQEYSNLRCRHIDFSRSDWQRHQSEFLGSASALLFNELMADGPDKVVAFRRNKRWTQTFEQQGVPNESAPARIKHNGVYAITGGLGKVGYALAEHLAAMAAKLVLIVRDELPDRSSWESWIAGHDENDVAVRKIERLLALEAKGAQVLVCKADVTDETQMTAAFEHAEHRFGPIDGVIHCAGQVRDSVNPLIESTIDHCRAQFLPKVKGVMILERVLKHRHVDFCVLMSSLSAVLGGLGFAAYAAANAYLDAFAGARHAEGNEAWLSINWDGWHVSESNDAMSSYSVSGPEGAHALAYALSWSDVPQLIHSTGNLKARMEKWIDLVQAEPVSMRLYLRNNIENYLPPSDPIELQLVGIWQQLLGLEGIGVDDEFFELGGDSLLATRLLSRIREVFPMMSTEYSMRDFFEEPTIKAGAERIRSALTMVRLAEKRQEIQQRQQLNEGIF